MESQGTPYDLQALRRQETRNPARSGVAALDRWIARKLLAARGNPPLVLRLWDGSEVGPDAQAALPRLQIHDRITLIRLVTQGDLGFGDAYSKGRIEIDGDLVQTLTMLCSVDGPKGWTDRFLSRRSRLPKARTHTLGGSRESIHHHYDIGNDFYALWLDAAMVYTCAYFATPTATLEEAQDAKLEHVCRKVCLRPGDRVLEAGCGWGALALYMARQHGAQVTAFNISHEQICFAREQAERQGLASRVEFVEDDYRNAGGSYDAFVSVGMLEHVGPENYEALGRVIDRCLRPNGRGLVHSIGRPQSIPMNRWIERRIFPGSYCPTLAEMAGLLEPWNLSVLDVENLRLHYAKTLEHWLERFEKNADVVRARFDEHFVRTWRLYLAGSIAAFLSGSFQLFQVVFARAASRDIPWTRAYLYTQQEARRADAIV
jgi:cyclopropane-fatty-acyl-phospholipid synthase